MTPEEKLVTTLEEGLAEVPLLDIHTHLDAAHMAARGLHDILLYHMVISDLVSAGCPSRARLSEEPDDEEARTRLSEAIPYLPYIQNTSIFWGVRIILRDLYGWNSPITADNWQQLDALIRSRAADPAWPRHILQRAGIRRTGTELWRRRDERYDDVLQYALEWAFFTRAQWGVNDIPLYELERAWNQPGPGAPLPVTLGEARPPLARTLRTLDDVRAAISHYVANIPYGQVLSTAQHISTAINYRAVSDEEMAAALSRRDQATPAERDVYASFILEAFLSELERHGDEIVYQFSFGAEPLPFETGSQLRAETVFEVAAIVARHPQLRFQVFLASAHANQALCTLARELPNLSLAGYWWHNFFPGVMRQVMGERLDMLATNKQVGFFSDAYCVDWAYAKTVLVRRQLAEVLAQKVAQRQYTVDEALAIARQILFESPQSLLGMRPQ
ncbi:MAG: hypothetical protein M1546_03515 [Chloroflexi bacterium]|nr:hypothetical protein [Chloroflexota bacterium]